MKNIIFHVVFLSTVRLELLVLRLPFLSFFYFYFFFSYCTSLMHEFAVEFVVFTNQKSIKIMNSQHL